MGKMNRLGSVRRYFADGRAKTLALTAAFLMAAILIAYGAIRIFRSIAVRELRPAPKASAAISPAPAGEPAEEASSGAALQQADTASPASAAEDEASMGEADDAVDGMETDAAAEPGNTPVTETPAPAAIAPAAAAPDKTLAASFTRSRMDAVLIGLDSAGKLDALAVLAARPDACTFIFLPKNTLDGAGAPLSKLSSPADVLDALESILSVRYDKYVTLRMDALDRCINAIGGVTVAGTQLDGAAAADFIASDGLDELIRVTKLQSLAVSCVQKAQKLSLFRLAAMRAKLAGVSGGNLSIEQSIALFSALRALEGNNISALLLPLDSTESGQTRCYIADKALTRALVQKIYSEN